MSLNINKSKNTTISKKQNIKEQLFIRGQQIEKVHKYSYLSIWVNEDWEYGIEVKCRIEMARSAFVNMYKIFKCHDFSLDTKIKILATSTLYYYMEPKHEH